MFEPLWPSARRFVLPVICVTLLVLNLGLQYQLRTTQARLSGCQARELRSLEVAKGTSVPAIEGISSSGQPIRVDPVVPRTQTLLLAFSTTCDFSRRNLPNWKRLVQQNGNRLRTGSLQLVLVDLTSKETAAYVAANGLDGLTVISRAEARTIKAYNLSMTPQTILLAEGRVSRVWSGVLSSSMMVELEQSLSSH